VDEATDRTDRTDAPENGVAPPRVVVGVDGSSGARAALVTALATAARRGATLDVVAAHPVGLYWYDLEQPDPRRVDEARADTERRARALVGAVRADPQVRAVPGAPDVPVTVVPAPGPPAEQLVRIAEGAALLVVGSRGRGPVRSTLLGSVALHCATSAPCPVLVVRPGPVDAPLRIVAGLDDSATARAALREAAERAWELGAEIEAVIALRMPDYWADVHAITAPPLEDLRERAVRRGREIVAEELGSPPPVLVRVVTETGPPGDALVRRAAGAVVLVVGSRSRNRLPGMLLGSAALHCVVSAPCPVLVVHPPGGRRHEGAPPAAGGHHAGRGRAASTRLAGAQGIVGWRDDDLMHSRP
jgi:nucleotide-binding universal stress UspA family protein